MSYQKKQNDDFNTSKNHRENGVHSHISGHGLDDRLHVFNRLIDSEIKREPIDNSIILKYDLYRSEVLFEYDYNSLVDEILPLISEIALMFNFRWKGGFQGDSAIYCYAPNVIDGSYDAIDAIVFGAKFSVCLRILFSKHECEFLHPDGKNVSIFALKQRLTDRIKNLSLKRTSYIKIGFAFGTLRFVNNLTSIVAHDEIESNPPLEAGRVTSDCTPSLARNKEIEKVFLRHGLRIEDNLIRLDREHSVCLHRYDRIVSKYSLHRGWKVLDKVYDLEQIQRYNQLITKISEQSFHHHYEGLYKARVSQKPRKKLNFSRNISLSHFIEVLPTWKMQKKLAIASQRSPQSVRRAIGHMATQVRKSAQTLYHLQKGYIYVSPFNMAQDINGLTSFSEEELPIKVKKELRESSQKIDYSSLLALEFQEYLSIIDHNLNQGSSHYRLVISLRRDQIESQYLDKPDDSKTSKFIEQLSTLKQQGLIVGVDISGFEERYSLEKMIKFLQKLKDRDLIYSIHSGEFNREKIVLGLRNVLLVIYLGIDSIGHALSFWYLHQAVLYHYQLLSDEDLAELLEVIHKFFPDDLKIQTLSQKKLLTFMSKKLKEKDLVIDCCLLSNIYTSLNCSIGGVTLNHANLDNRFYHHPLVSILIKKGPKIINDLPQIRFNADDPVVTQYGTIHEIQTLTLALLNHGWSLDDVIRFYEKVAQNYQELGSNEEVVVYQSSPSGKRK